MTSPEQRTALRHHALAGLAVAALVSLAAWWPMPRAPFVLELTAGAAQLHMAQAGSLAGQVLAGQTASLRADGFARLESGDPRWLSRAGEGAAGGGNLLALRAERLALRRISFGAGAQLGFESAGGGGGVGDAAAGVRLTIEGAPHAADLELGGAVAFSLAGAPSERVDYPVAEWIKLVSDVNTNTSELWLPRAPAPGYVWRGLRPVALRFVERQLGADGPVRFQSALLQATLRLPATAREVKLAAGSALVLDGLEVDQCELVLGDVLTLKVSGSARHIGTQTGGFEQSLDASLLAYAAHNHGLAALWSAAGLLWGISTWLRKQFGNTV